MSSGCQRHCVGTRAWLVVDGDGVFGGEREFVGTGDCSAGGDAGAEDCAGDGYQFEEFSGTGINLLVYGCSEADGIGELRGIFPRLGSVVSERDGFWSKREERGAICLCRRELEGAAVGDSVANDGAQQI